MIKIKFHANWRSDDFIMQSFSKYTKDGSTWNNLELTCGDDYDYIVILNYPSPNLKFDNDRAIFLQTEAKPIRNGWGQYNNIDHSKYFYVLPIPTVFGWSYANTYSELMENSPIKTNEFSGIISTKNSFIGQQRRLQFVKKYLLKLDNYEHYGRGIGKQTLDKSDALLPYKYTFNAENTYENNYFTEKIHDAIVAECLCFYDGCPNLEDYYDSRSFVRVDLSKPDEAIKVINNSIKENIWEDRIGIIRSQKQRILNELQPMPLIEKIIQHNGDNNKICTAIT